jgi:hypothetical protein
MSTAVPSSDRVPVFGTLETSGRIEENDGASRDDMGSPRSVGGVPVYVMLPLDTVSRDGQLQRPDELAERMSRLRRVGVEGVMVDVWWGIVERDGPLRYDWKAYLDLARLASRIGLRLHAVLSFHSCGANRDDDYHVPLPRWVTDAVARDPDGLLFADRAGTKSDEYLSLWADESPMMIMDGPGSFPSAQMDHAAPRTPLECYRDFMVSFKEAFEQCLGSVVTEVLVGCGPCGELRYPAYAASRGWQFPGVGEFQCYDRRALESLRAAACNAGRPEWGAAGPHDAGSYNSHPDDTGFFANGKGRVRLQHAKSEAAVLTNHRWSGTDSPGGSMDNVNAFGGNGNGTSGDSVRPAVSAFPRGARSLDDLREIGGEHPGASRPNGRWDSDYGRFFLGWYSGELVAHGDRVMGAAATVFNGTGARLALKCAGIHWWYRTRSHAAELTTGYYNVLGGSDLDQLGESFSQLGSSHSLSRVDSSAGGRWSVDLGRRPEPSMGPLSMGARNPHSRRSAEWPPGAYPSTDSMRDSPTGTSPTGLTKSGGLGSKKWSNGSLEGEGSPGSSSGRGGLDRVPGYDGVMAMCRRHGVGVTFTCAEMSDGEHPPEMRCGPEGLLRQVVATADRHGVEISAENALYRCDAGAYKQMVRNSMGLSGDGGGGMHSFTFLRLCESLMEHDNFAQFETFVRDMSGDSAGGR